MVKYCDNEPNCISNTPPTSKVMKVPDISTKDNASTHSKDNEAVSIPAQETNGDVPPPLSPDGSEPSSSFSEPPSHPDNQALNDQLDNPLEPASSVSSPPLISQPMSNNTNSQKYKIQYPHIHVAAIDNGLAFPFKHPDQWRSYPYGWLYLPEALIGQPFTTNTRNHFLSMLSNPKWWKETVNELRRLFSMDADFEPGMFEKQIAVLKGQGWNIVETLNQPDQGPIDLCARQNTMVWDDEETIEIPPERNADGIEINADRNREGTSEVNEEQSFIPPNPRRSYSEDNDNSSGRNSLSTSAPATSTYSAASSSKQKWDRFKERFNFDSKNKSKYSLDDKRTKQVIIERLEFVKGGTPFFSWC